MSDAVPPAVRTADPGAAPVAALILDMDGTMCDSMPFHDAAWVRFLANNGVALDVERFLAETAGLRNAEIIERFLGDRLAPGQAADFGRRKEALFRTLYRPHVEPVAGLHRTLAWARTQGIALAVATSADRDNVAFTLDALGLADGFDVVVGAEDVARGKPHPDGYRLASERLGVAADRCLVIEDSTVGIAAATRAGMRVAVIQTTLVDAAALAALPNLFAAAPDFDGLDLPGRLGRLNRGPAP